jgi:hypothetical protein
MEDSAGSGKGTKEEIFKVSIQEALKAKAESKKDQIEKWRQETWKHPRYDEVFFEGVKWLDSQ